MERLFHEAFAGGAALVSFARAFLQVSFSESELANVTKKNILLLCIVRGKINYNKVFIISLCPHLNRYEYYTQYDCFEIATALLMDFIILFLNTLGTFGSKTCLHNTLLIYIV